MFATTSRKMGFIVDVFVPEVQFTASYMIVNFCPLSLSQSSVKVYDDPKVFSSKITKTTYKYIIRHVIANTEG